MPCWPSSSAAPTPAAASANRGMSPRRRSCTCSLGLPTRHLDLQFVAHAPSDAQITISDESEDLRWWPVDALPPGTDYALAHLVSRATTRRV